MTTPVVVIIETGLANTASVIAAMRRLGAEAELSTDAVAVREASHVILPGVGAFGPGMATLRAHGLDDAMRERVDADRPTLCVCLGMQLLFARSEESPGVEGLGVFEGAAAEFPPTVVRPQFGWNKLTWTPGHGQAAPIADGYAYFANSYRISEPPAECAVAVAEHGGPFVASLRRGRLIACQFHPELSGPWGLRLMEAWLTGVDATTGGGVSC